MKEAEKGGLKGVLALIVMSLALIVSLDAVTPGVVVSSVALCCVVLRCVEAVRYSSCYLLFLPMW